MVWVLLRGRGMVGPFASVCYMRQVEGVHAGVSLPGCLWPHIAGDSGGMSLHSLRWNQHSGYRAVVIALIPAATGSCV